MTSDIHSDRRGVGSLVVLTAVIDGVGDDRLEGSGEAAVAVLQEGGELEPDDVQVHNLSQILGLLLQTLLVALCSTQQHPSDTV